MDKRYVYGATCTWRGPIQAVSADGGIPRCPQCGSVLYEVEDSTKWFDQIAAFDADGHEGYSDFQEWLAALPKCIPSGIGALDAYVAAGNPEPPGLR